MKAAILTLPARTSTEEICKNIAQVIDQFEGRVFVEKVNQPSEDYCAVISTKWINKNESEVLYQALEVIRLYERERDFMSEDGTSKLDIVLEDMRTEIRRCRIRKLPKLTQLMTELIEQYS